MNVHNLSRSFAISVGLLFLAASIQAVQVGPRLPTEDTRKQDSLPTLAKLPIPAMDFAVVVLNPNLDETDDNMRKKGIWPEVRKTEAIRTAYRLKQTFERLGQFENVLVAPTPAVSADLYFLGDIEESTTEDMKLRWTVYDARGQRWFPLTRTFHRVPLGWHQRYYKPGTDAFQPLYDEIATKIYDKLKSLAKDHARNVDKNKSRARRGDAPRLSKLDEITHVRDLMLARYFAPDVYGNALKENSRNEIELVYLPDTSSNDWFRTQAFATRDLTIAAQYDKEYELFFEQVNPSYEAWLNELYPYARESRREAKRAKTNQIVGGLVLLASLAVAADAGSTGARDAALAVGGAVGGGLLVKGLVDREDYRRNLNLFNEMSASYHDNFEPMNVEIDNEIVTLEGTAAQQFDLWRALLREEYQSANNDAYVIEVVEEDE